MKNYIFSCLSKFLYPILVKRIKYSKNSSISVFTMHKVTYNYYIHIYCIIGLLLLMPSSV